MKAKTTAEYKACQAPDDKCAAGVVIDGMIVQLEGEPPKANPGSWYKPYS